MMLPSRAETTTIRRLRVRTSLPDPQATRMRVARTLNAAALSPPGLSASVILCVRHLRDPHPGGIDGGQGGLHANPDWERSVQAALERLAREAARPALGFVPPSAEAVLFADRSELLACLAADWMDGSLAVRWWWRGLLGNNSLDRALLNAWQDTPAYIPAALERLAVQRRAVEFVHHLDERQTQLLLERLAAWHIPGLVSTVLAATVVENEEGTPTRQDVTLDSGQKDSTLAAVAPWSSFAPEAEKQGMTIPQRLLLGIGLGLGRAPRVVYSTTFAARVRSWLEGRLKFPHLSAPGTEDDPHSPEITKPTREKTREHRQSPARARQDGVVSTEEKDGQSLRDPAGKLEPAQKSRVRAPRGQEGSPAPHRGRGSKKIIEAATATSHERAAIKATGEVLPATQPAKAVASAPLLITENVESDFAGAFYLINLGISLGLYGDFTTPLSPGIALPIWDFIALLARGLLGPSLESDPLWTLLAHLAGRRPGQRPGYDFHPENEWRLPPDWLDAFAEPGEWCWSVRRERLRVLHPAGFLIMDLPLRRKAKPIQEEGLLQTVRLHLQPYEVRDRLRRAKVRAPHGRTSVERWLAHLLPYVSARLMRAMPHTSTGEQAGQLAFRQHGLVQVTPARLDVRFSLAELPVEVRLSGLDRDPGWVPAAGRTIAFHYE